MCPSQPTRSLVEGPRCSGLNVEPGRSSQVESLEKGEKKRSSARWEAVMNVNSYFGSLYLTFKLPSDPR